MDEPRLEVVLDTNDSVAIGLAKASLDEAGIPFVLGNAISTLVNDVTPMLKKQLQVLVSDDRVEEARDVLAPLLHPVSGGNDSLR